MKRQYFHRFLQAFQVWQLYTVGKWVFFAPQSSLIMSDPFSPIIIVCVKRAKEMLNENSKRNAINFDFNKLFIINYRCIWITAHNGRH